MDIKWIFIYIYEPFSLPSSCGRVQRVWGTGVWPWLLSRWQWQSLLFLSYWLQTGHRSSDMPWWVKHLYCVTRPLVYVAVLNTNLPQIVIHALVSQTSVLCDKAFCFCRTEYKLATDLQICLGGLEISIMWQLFKAFCFCHTGYQLATHLQTYPGGWKSDTLPNVNI